MNKETRNSAPARGTVNNNRTSVIKNYTPATSGVQSNHTPTTQQAPAAPAPPSPKKK
jgi:hypothetical protein